MSLEVVTVMHPKKAPAEFDRQREELVHRVASSVTFEKSPRLRAFFLHVCRCAIEDKSEEATEQQIGIFVYGRRPSYNPNDDNIVRSQARVLRMKLEHHFINEGKDEPVIITIPKGQYLPIFENRHIEPPPPQAPLPILVAPLEPEPRQSSNKVLAGAIVLLALVVAVLGYMWIQSRFGHSRQQLADGSAETNPHSAQNGTEPQVAIPPITVVPETGAIRFAAGHTGAPYIDQWGHSWGSDQYFEGGVVKAGPSRFFPPVADAKLFKSIRQAASSDQMSPQSERGFQYNIPLPPGVYELKLFFADPLRMLDTEMKEDSQNLRHFEIDLNGHPLLVNFDPIADGGAAPLDIRAFKDVRPADDGKLHLRFQSEWGDGAFVSAIELTPGKPGRMEPIRIRATPSDFVDADGTRWSGDKFFIDGRYWAYPNPEIGPRVPDLYSGERHGNFNYAIPVPPGSYTVKLHFLESFFSPLIPAAECHGVGCRVFDVSCNGVMLLQDFDIFKVAPGAFHPVVREFHGLHPNGQGKLLIAFSPKVNYAEVRAIEVIDEAK